MPDNQNPDNAENLETQQAFCTIEWNSLVVKEWDARFQKIRRSTLLQHFPYAQAMRKVHQQSSRHGLIKIKGEEAGLVQLQEVGLFRNLVHSVLLDRGPLWFDGYGHKDHWRAFIAELDKQLPKRGARKRRFLPELENKPVNEALFSESGWQKHKKSRSYHTMWMDLTKPTEALREGFHQKWRNSLNKAERRDLILDIDDRGLSLDILMRHYKQDRLKKRYSGAAPRTLKALAEFMIPRKEFLIFNALSESSTGKDMVASILILVHGSSATYQVGWTSNVGRDANAHHFLIWQAINYLQNKGIMDLDMGGLNEEYAEGVSSFKKRMNGTESILLGHYR